MTRPAEEGNFLALQTDEGSETFAVYHILLPDADWLRLETHKSGTLAVLGFVSNYPIGKFLDSVNSLAGSAGIVSGSGRLVKQINVPQSGLPDIVDADVVFPLTETDLRESDIDPASVTMLHVGTAHTDLYYGRGMEPGTVEVGAVLNRDSPLVDPVFDWLGATCTRGPMSTPKGLGKFALELLPPPPTEI